MRSIRSHKLFVELELGDWTAIWKSLRGNNKRKKSTSWVAPGLYFGGPWDRPSGVSFWGKGSLHPTFALESFRRWRETEMWIDARGRLTEKNSSPCDERKKKEKDKKKTNFPVTSLAHIASLTSPIPSSWGLSGAPSGWGIEDEGGSLDSSEANCSKPQWNQWNEPVFAQSSGV